MIYIIIVFLLTIFIYIFKLSTIENSKSNTSYQRKIQIDLIGFNHFEEFDVRGVFDELTKSYIIQFCKEKHPVSLISEKDNEFSENAIKIEHEGFDIGYVPDKMTDIKDIKL